MRYSRHGETSPYGYCGIKRNLWSQLEPHKIPKLQFRQIIAYVPTVYNGHFEGSIIDQLQRVNASQT